MPESVRRLRLWLWGPLTALATAGVTLAGLWIGLGEPAADPSPRIQDYGPRRPGDLVANCLRAGGAGPLPEVDGRCRRGDLLSLKVVPRPGERFLSALTLGPDDAARWYFPGPESGSLPLGPAGLASRGIRLDPGHPVGRYRLVVLLGAGPLEGPLPREALEARRTGRLAGLRVLEADLELEE